MIVLLTNYFQNNSFEFKNMNSSLFRLKLN